MSMKKFTKKMLAIVAAGAMTMGLAMPAMAAEGTTADTVNNAKEAYISKTYNTEVGKAETFSLIRSNAKNLTKPRHPIDRACNVLSLRGSGDRWCMVVVSSCREMLG